MTNIPTDAELIAFAVETGMRVRTGKGVVSFARAVLTRWGQPAHSGEPVAYVRTSRNAFTPCRLEICKSGDDGAVQVFTHPPAPQPSPGEQNESAYQRGYMDGMAKGCRDVEAAPQQEAQDPCPTCAALARTVMLDQASFDRKPNCYGIRQITDDEGVEEWEDIHTSPDVAREEANYMMATGRGEIYEVVPLWTTPQPEPSRRRRSNSFKGPHGQQRK